MTTGGNFFAKSFLLDLLPKTPGCRGHVQQKLLFCYLRTFRVSPLRSMTGLHVCHLAPSASTSEEARAKNLRVFAEEVLGRTFFQKGPPPKALQRRQPLAILFIFVYIGIPPFASQYD